MTSMTVVIPVYHAEDSLQELSRRLKVVLKSRYNDFEIVMVEDCGSDCSWDIITKLSKQDRRIKGIRLSKNFGQHSALLCGIRAARGEVIVTMDDDLQHPPEEIPKLIQKLDEGYDVVYGAPQADQQDLWRRIGSRVIRLVLRIAMRAETASDVSAFRAFRARVRNSFADFQGPFVSIDVLLSWGTSRFAAVTIRHDPRRSGESNYSFRKLVSHALNMMTGFSTLPLRLASMVGFAFTVFGLAVLIFVLGRYFIQGSSVPGFPFLASVIAVFSGAQLFALGIIGEYLARMHFRSMERPPYVIHSTTESETFIARHDHSGEQRGSTSTEIENPFDRTT